MRLPGKFLPVLSLLGIGILSIGARVTARGRFEAEGEWKDPPAGAKNLPARGAAAVPAFRLLARLAAFPASGRPTEGSYGLVWRSPDSWRDETLFPGFAQVRTTAGRTLYLSRSPAGLTPELFHLLHIADLLRELASGGNPALDGTSEAEEFKAWSQWLSSRASTIAEYSFGPTPAIPVHLFYKQHPFEFEFGRMLSFDGRQVPGVVTQLDSGKSYVRLEVTSLVADQGKVSMEPPKDAFPLPWCENPKPAAMQGRFGHDWLPTYTPPKNGWAIYGIVGVDGRWHNLTVVRSSGEPDLEKEYMHHSITRELFYPANCGKEKVVEERIIEVLPFN